MSQVLRGRPQGEFRARCFLEVLRTDSEALLVALDDDCNVNLQSHPLHWFEVGEHYTGGKREFQFDREFIPLLRKGLPYDTLDAARKIIKGCHSAPGGFKNGALSALVDVLPSGDVHLFTQEDGFVGRFAERADAEVVARAIRQRPIIFGSAVDIKGLPVVDLGAVLFALDPDREWPAKLRSNHHQEVFDMAKKKAKESAKKVDKAQAAQRRADGPVNQARVMFAKMKDASTADIIAACEKAGINKNTAQTQLGKWRKENGIVVKRGGPRAKKVADKPAAKPATKKAGKKKGKGKEKAAAKGGDAPFKPGAKRHRAAPTGTAPKGTEPVPPQGEAKPDASAAGAADAPAGGTAEDKQ